MVATEGFFVTFPEKLSKIKSIYFVISFLVGISLFVGIIIFVFLPTAEVIDKTGYTIDNFQLSYSSDIMGKILLAWQNIIDVVIYQTIMDYFFILGNFMFMSSSFLLLAKKFDLHTKPRYLAYLGFWFELTSTILDSTDNLITFYILLNRENFFQPIVYVLSVINTVKFIISIPIEYSLIVILVCLGIINFVKKRRIPLTISETS